LSGHISLIAGNGNFPRMFIAEAKARGITVSAVGFKGETEPAVEKLATTFQWIELGKLQALVDALKAYPAKEVALAGGIKKTRFFLPIVPDGRALRVLKSVVEKKDDGLLRALARELESEGLAVVPSTIYLGEAMAKKGQLSPRRPDAREQEDIAFGLKLAREIGTCDIGQTVVVKDAIPLAIEAIEGTDACIARGGKLGSKGAVVVKTLKPGQDQRFDLPVIGPGTIKAMKKAGCTAIGVEAGHVLMIDTPEVLRLAAKWKIAVEGI
jgi:UDP-2,3-diacylglucosamine hydrolase